MYDRLVVLPGGREAVLSIMAYTCTWTAAGRLRPKGKPFFIKCMPLSRESVPKFGNLFLIRLKYLNVSPFVKKIKELLLNFLRPEDDYVEVSRLIKLFNTLG